MTRRLCWRRKWRGGLSLHTRLVAARDAAGEFVQRFRNRAFGALGVLLRAGVLAIAKALDDITSRVVRGDKPCVQTQAAALLPAPAQSPGQPNGSPSSLNPALALSPVLKPVSSGATVSAKELSK